MYRFLPDEYLYHKGGGNGAMIAMMMQQQQQAAEAKEAERLRNEKAEIKAEQVAQEAKEEKKQEVVKSVDKVGQAYDSALGFGRQKLNTRGIDADADPYGIMSLYRASLDKARAGAPEIVTDANALFSPTLLDDAMSEARTTQRNKFGSQVKNTFGDDFGLRSFADTADDAILNALLDTQKTETVTALDRALARGTINEVGRGTADKELQNMFKAGLAKANSLGGTVLSDYRNQLDTGVGKVRDRAGNWDFGDTFDFTKEQSGLDILRNSLTGRLEGDILNAIGGTDFFDEDLLLGKAGNASGIGNTPLSGANGLGQGSLALTSGVADRAKDESNKTGRKLTPLDEVF